MRDDEDMMNVLRAISQYSLPVGASFLTDKLHYSQATLGRILLACEEEGLLQKVSNKGRVITPEGQKVLQAHLEKEKKIETAHKLINRVGNASVEDLIDIIEVRKLLEKKTAELACQHASDKEINELKGILMEYLQAIYKGELGNDQDRRIHLKIAELSRNKTLFNILDLILTTDNSYTTFAIVTRSMEVDITQWHTDIVDAIADRNSELASSNMLKHLILLEEGIKEYLKQEKE